MYTFSISRYILKPLTNLMVADQIPSIHDDPQDRIMDCLYGL